MELNERSVERIKPILIEAGNMLLKKFTEPKKVFEQSSHDVKLELDLNTELFIKDRLAALFPDSQFIAEETEQDTKEEPNIYYWVIDPIDGTSNYFQQVPHFCISLALRWNQEHLLGFIYDPVRNEMFWALRDHGAFLNRTRLRMHNLPLRDSYCAAGLYKTEDTIHKSIKSLELTANTFNKVRMSGSAALDMAWVAAGRFQGYYEYGIHLWDIAAGDIIIQEAGGKVVTKPYQTRYTYFIAAGTQNALEFMLENCYFD